MKNFDWDVVDFIFGFWLFTIAIITSPIWFLPYGIYKLTMKLLR